MIEVGTRVKLKTFNGSQFPPEDIYPEENYWKLIGKEGKVVHCPKQETLYASFSKEPRILITFFDSATLQGLECHNEVPNSLWIIVSDLELLNCW